MRDQKCPKCRTKIRLIEEGPSQGGAKWSMRWHCAGCQINIHGEGKSRADCVRQFRAVKRRVANQIEKGNARTEKKLSQDRQVEK